MAIDPIITESYFKPIAATSTGRVAFQVRADDGKYTTLECGYTGVRDITGLMSNLTSGTVTVARDGYTVIFTFEEVKFAAGGAALTAAMPADMAMFYPSAGVISAPLSQLNAQITRMAITSGGILRAYNTSTTDVHSGVLTFTTSRAWGNALPGVARGTGVVFL